MQQVTTTKAGVQNSRVNLSPGTYRVRYALEVVGGAPAPGRKTEIALSLRLDGDDLGTVRSKIAGDARNARDIVVQRVVRVVARRHVDAAVHMASDTPPGAAVQVRRVQVKVQRIR